MIDLLLVHPPKCDYGRSRNIFRGFNSYSFLSNIAPLGLLYVAASCKNQGYNIKILDMESEKLSLNSIRRYLHLYDPRAIGISVTAPVANNLSILSKIIKEEKNIPIIVGGPFATLFPEPILKNRDIDFVIRYEGEEKLVELLDSLLRAKGSFSEIRNVSYRSNGNVINNETDATIEDIDLLAFPARELLPIKTYFSILAKNIPSIGIIGSRGCPYSCIFCSSVYKTSRRRSARNIVDEIETVIKSYNIKNFDFFDPVFNLDNKWVVDLCNEILRRKLKIAWRARCRPDLIKESAIAIMKEAGCKVITLSIESSNNITLKFLNKGYVIEDVMKAIEIIRFAKVDIHGYFILGCPNETKEDMLNSIKFAKEMMIDYVDFHILTPFAGSELFREGRLKHPTLTQKEIKGLYIRALCSFYLRPWWVTKEFFKFVRNPQTYLGILYYLGISVFKACRNVYFRKDISRITRNGGGCYGKEDIFNN